MNAKILFSFQQKETEFAGYLSLHLNPTGLILKWTPNQLINANASSSIDETSPQPLPKTKSGFWNYAMYIDINTIVYLHCHQHGIAGASIVLVGQDGVQHAPIKFPKGSHLLQFLTCLENGLMPNGQLDPPLWNESGKGKIFPKLQRRSTYDPKRSQAKDAAGASEQDENAEADDQQEDFVFRIVNSKSNVSVKPVGEDGTKRKLQYSLSAGNRAEKSTASPNSASISISAETTQQKSAIKTKLGSILSSFSSKTPYNSSSESINSLVSASNNQAAKSGDQKSATSSNSSLNRLPGAPPASPTISYDSAFAESHSYLVTSLNGISIENKSKFGLV